jgi:tetratricopeptide (TPR) repeat protein
MKKQFFISLLLVLLTLSSFAQVFNNPIASKISHPELKITKIEITDNSTIVSLKVTNKLSSGGWFCADKNIYLKNTKGIEIYNLVNSENIPVCPEKHEFAYTGEVLEFKLYFEKIAENIQFIDLIENCSNACFSFNGIILDNAHNEKIRTFEKGFEFYQNNEPEKANSYFEKVLEGDITIQSQIYGLSYYYLIVTYMKQGFNEKAQELYNKLLESDIEDKVTFIKELENTIIVE